MSYSHETYIKIAGSFNTAVIRFLVLISYLVIIQLFLRSAFRLTSIHPRYALDHDLALIGRLR